MAIDNMFLHFNNDTTFQEQKSEIKDQSITFVKDSKKIYTHESEYNTINWGNDSLSNFIIAETEEDFQNQVDSGVILNEAIAFMSDTKRIWTHGTWFANTLDAESIQELISNSETLQEFINSLSIGIIDFNSFFPETSGTLTGIQLSELEKILQNKAVYVFDNDSFYSCSYQNSALLISLYITSFIHIEGILNLNFIYISVVKSTGQYNYASNSINLYTSGSGTKYLADNGEYKDLPDVATVVELDSSVLSLTNNSTSEEIATAFGSVSEFTTLIEQIRDSSNIINEVFFDTDDYIGHLNASLIVSKTQEQAIVRFINNNTQLVLLVITNTDGTLSCSRTEYDLGLNSSNNYISSTSVTNVSIVTELPENPDDNTLYLIVEEEEE